MRYLLGIDNGSTVTKAGIFTASGEEIAVAGRKVKIEAPQPGWAERDPEHTWQLTAESIREVLNTSKIDPADIAAVAVTGYGNGLYLLDKAGLPVRPAIESSDNRARDVSDRWLAEGVWDKALPKTAQSIWPAQPNTLLAWVREYEPQVMEKAAWVVLAKDFTRFKLTGEIQAELTDMSASSLMNVPQSDYDMDVLQAFGLAEVRDLLPPLIRSSDVAGEITPQAAEATGLKAGTPVAGGMFDIDACGLASGMVDESQMCVVSGTWGNNQYISSEPLISKQMFMTSCYAIPGYYLMLEGSPTSASNFEWFVREFFSAGSDEKGGESAYEICNQLVAETRPEESAILFLPFLYGSNMHPDAKSCLLGLQGWHTRAHVLRAVYEGVVFSHMTHLERLLAFRERPETVFFTGGASRSEVWTQIFVDCFQIPFEMPAGTELGALGAAISAAVAVDIYPDFFAAVKAMTRKARVQEPNIGNKDIYREKFEKYRKVQNALEPVWNDLSSRG